MTSGLRNSRRTIPWYTQVTSEPFKILLKEGVRSLGPTREDIQRYRGILDALVEELEEDGSL